MNRKEQQERYEKAKIQELKSTLELAENMKGLRLRLLWEVHDEKINLLKKIYNIK